jgi:hypothetical protein
MATESSCSASLWFDRRSVYAVYTGLFHVGYLHEGASGATTADLVTYSDLNPNSEPFIRAGGVNDPVAVFDGSVIPRGINGMCGCS